jgi:aspartate aminotransferase
MKTKMTPQMNKSQAYKIIENKRYNLKKLRNSVKVLASETFSSVSAPIQYAAIAAYENDQSKYLETSRNILKAVGEYVYDNLRSNKVIINKPQGGFYLMPEFLDKKFQTSQEMCEDLLNNTGVVLLPGSDFGFLKERMIARLSFTDFDGDKFMQNKKKTKKIDNSFVSKFISIKICKTQSCYHPFF